MTKKREATELDYLRMVQMWRELKASLERLTEMFPDRPPPRDLAWEKAMDEWAEKVMARFHAGAGSPP